MAGKSYSPAERERITRHVCEQLIEKRPLYKIFAEDDGLCSAAQFAVWQREDEQIAEQVACAREAACEALIEETVQIADGTDELPSSDAQIRKVRIYAREKAAQMLAPRKYGQRLDVTSGGKPLEAAPPVTIQINARVDALLALAAQRAQQQAAPAMIDVTPEVSIDDVMG